jgi:chemotaxis protein CheD
LFLKQHPDQGMPEDRPGPLALECERRLRRLMPFCGTSPIVRLMPGSIFFSPEPHRLMTLLGSCVAVCLWDSQKRMGGMTHSLVPRSGKVNDAAAHHATDAAILELIRRMGEAGCRPAFMQAKLFGGFNALQGMRRANRIGAANIEAATHILKQHSIEVVAKEILGDGGMVICQDTGTGEVVGRKIAPLARPVEESALL